MDRLGRCVAGASGAAQAAASELCGRRIHDCDGVVVGSIAELVIDLKAGCVTRAPVASGGFLGVGECRFAVPWRALRPNGLAFVLRSGDAGEHAPARRSRVAPDLDEAAPTRFPPRQAQR